jgi:calcineurin-like phosphoesterase
LSDSCYLELGELSCETREQIIPKKKKQKRGGVYNNLNFVIIQNNVTTKKNGLIKKKEERWSQNGIKKKWDYKYPFLLSPMAG